MLNFSTYKILKEKHFISVTYFIILRDILYLIFILLDKILKLKISADFLLFLQELTSLF